MPVVIFITCLDLEQKSSFVDEHELKFLISYEILNYCILINTLSL
jgi:hypothetical protein